VNETAPPELGSKPMSREQLQYETNKSIILDYKKNPNKSTTQVALRP
jgi:hypothetical protein